MGAHYPSVNKSLFEMLIGDININITAKQGENWILEYYCWKLAMSGIRNKKEMQVYIIKLSNIMNK